MRNGNNRRRRDGNRAIIYTPQSTFREESISLELQAKTCRDYACSRDYRVIEVISEPGISGLEFDKRPGIQRAIELIQSNEADVIVSWKWSRISREEYDQVYIMREIDKGGGRIESATEPADDETSNGWFLNRINQLMAQLESKQKSEQWKAAQAHRIERGLPAGGAPPLGYRRNGKGQAFVPDPVYGPIVAEMYDLYLRGRGPQGIAKTLNDRGLRTPFHRSPNGKGRGSKPFGVPSVIRALDSGFAAGYVTRHGEKIKGVHEPLIDEATWWAYQTERQRRQPRPVKARQGRWFLGGGLTVCARCGTNLIVNSYNAAKSQAICSKYRGDRTCEGVWIDRVKLETVVGLWLGGRVEEWANAAEAMADVDDERARLVKAIDEARSAEERIRDGLRAAQRLVAHGAMSEDDFLDRKREVDAELQELAQHAAELQTRLDPLDPTGDAYERIVAATPADMPPDEWNQLLRRVIRRVVVGPRSITIEPWQGESAVYDRAVVTPPRKRSPQAKDAQTGRFVRRAAP